MMTVPAIIMLVAGFGAGQLVRSPQQVAADAQPPAPLTLTALVTEGRIQRTESADAQMERTQIASVSPAVPGGDARPIVSAVRVAVGDTVAAGDALLDVGGRPTFLMKGAITAYRSIGPDMSGADVSQLQEGLRGLGYQVAKDESVVGTSTKAAISKFYADRGYPVSMVGESELEAAEAAHTSAERAVGAAETALKRARRDYDLAVTAAEAPSPAADDDTQGSPTAPTRDAIDDAKEALGQAREDLAKAASVLTTARRAAGPEVPLGEMAFLAALPATVDALSVTNGKEVGEGAVRLASGPLAAIGKLPRTVSHDIAVGNPATLISPDGQRWDGKVSAVLALPAEEGQIEGDVQVTVTSEDRVDVQTGTTIRMNITTHTGKGDELLVPESAIATTADGESRVRVEAGEAYRDVVVSVGESGDGLVAVNAADGGQLAEGDRVVIGVSS